MALKIIQTNLLQVTLHKERFNVALTSDSHLTLNFHVNFSGYNLLSSNVPHGTVLYICFFLLHQIS